jgi:hypothetical protein
VLCDRLTTRGNLRGVVGKQGHNSAELHAEVHASATKVLEEHRKFYKKI